MFKVDDRVCVKSGNRKGTIKAVYSDLVMVYWDDRLHDSADPMAHDQIAHIPSGWDTID